MVTLLREMDDRQVQAINSLLPANAATIFQPWVEGLHRNPEQPADQALASLLDAFWQGGLQAYTKMLLDVVQSNTFAYAQQSSHDKIIADATEAIRINTKAAEMYGIRAWAYANKCEHDKAIADYTEVLRLNPKDGWTHYSRAAAYTAQHKFDEAIADYTEAISLELEDLKTYYFARAWAYAQKVECDKAIADYTEIIRLDQKDADAYCAGDQFTNGRASRIGPWLTATANHR